MRRQRSSVSAPSTIARHLPRFEATALVPTDEQALLLTYRPLCLELYAKERQLESLEIARQGDKGRSLEEQFDYKSMFS